MGACGARATPRRRCVGGAGAAWGAREAARVLGSQGVTPGGLASPRGCAALQSASKAGEAIWALFFPNSWPFPVLLAAPPPRRTEPGAGVSARAAARGRFCSSGGPGGGCVRMPSFGCVRAG